MKTIYYSMMLFFGFATIALPSMMMIALNYGRKLPMDIYGIIIIVLASVLSLLLFTLMVTNKPVSQRQDTSYRWAERNYLKLN